MTGTNRRLALRAAGVLTGAVVVGSLTVTPASAATVVGATFFPGTGCGDGFTLVQASAPAYSTPVAGVITSWRFQANGAPPNLKFKVLRPAGGTSLTVIASSDPVTPTASTLSSFPIRVPVQAGDVIGVSVLAAGNCQSSGGDVQYVAGDAAVGNTAAYGTAAGTLDLAASVEADADHDGYGDETQDGCPSQAAAHGACLDITAPLSRFTAGPKRTTKSTAKFAFTSDDPGARFECRITGKRVRTIEESTFGPCTSPKKFKHLRPGKYQVSVRAIDAAGNVEVAPPTVKLKVEKKKGR